MITTSADGRVITTKADNDGNGVYEEVDTRVTNADGSVTETLSSYNNVSGSAMTGTAVDGSAAPNTVTSISADGLVSSTVQGGTTATTILLPGANGSYQWTETSATKGTLASASHMIDADKVDTWTSTVGGAVTTTRIDEAAEQKDIGTANSIYKVVLGRSMQDGETQALVKYISGGVLNQTQLASDLLGSTEFSKRYGPLSNSDLIVRFYENVTGFLPSNSDLLTYLGQLSKSTMTQPAVAVAVAQMATDEIDGNGLLQLLAGAGTITPTAVSLIPTANASLNTTETSYQSFVASFPTPAGALTNTQTQQFLAQVYPSQSGVTTQQNSNNLVATTADKSSSSELLYATNQAINATTASLKTIVDVGSGNTLQAGAGSGILLAGGASDMLVGGSGTSTLVALGANETVSTGTGTTSVASAGSGTHIDASSGASSISIATSGINNVITGATSKTSIDVSGTGAQIAGTGATVTMEGGASAELSGSGNTINSVGGSPFTLDASTSKYTSNGASTLTVNGSNNTISTDLGSTITLNGSSETVNANGSNISIATGKSAALTGNDDTVTQAGNSTLSVAGASDFVEITGNGDVDDLANTAVLIDSGVSSATLNGNFLGVSDLGGATYTVNASGSNIIVGSGSTLTNTGNENFITAGSGATITDNGDYTDINAAAGSDRLFLNGTFPSLTDGSQQITLTNGTASVTGTYMVQPGSAVPLINNSQLTLSGAGQLSLTGNNNAIMFADSTGTEAFAIGSESVSQSTSGLTLTGFASSSAIGVANGKASIAFGNGNTLTTSAVPGEVDGLDTSGIKRWDEIYNKATGALNETDQYRYNASNQLAELDRYNGSSVLTEADFYNPSTSAAIGSYHYGSGGVVNEVVDIANNHDWFRNANGSYTDKTSGATSQTQPTLSHS